MSDIVWIDGTLFLVVENQQYLDFYCNYSLWITIVFYKCFIFKIELLSGFHNCLIYGLFFGSPINVKICEQGLTTGLCFVG